VICHLGLEGRERTNHGKGSIGIKVRAGLGSLRNITEGVLLEPRGPGGSGVRAMVRGLGSCCKCERKVLKSFEHGSDGI